MCYRHVKNLAAVLGFKIRTLTSERLEEQLLAYHEAAIRNKIGSLKINTDTYHWFRTEVRSARPADGLGSYKLIPRQEVLFTITESEQLNLRGELRISFDDWDRVGSVIVDCFQWWYDGKEYRYDGLIDNLKGRTVYDVIDAEFSMYYAHLRMINNKPNYGWLRNMYYSLGQQVMRQDPLYYLIYCSLRPDRNVNLVAYPYYAKFTHEGDKTFFRHIDVNVKDLAHSGKGANMIQGTVSIDNETSDDCTMILLGMYKRL